MILLAKAESILKTQNTACDDDLSRKAYMEKIKYKDGTTAEERYQKMLQLKQQEQEHRQQNLSKHRDDILKKADKLIQDVQNTDRFDTDYEEYI